MSYFFSIRSIIYEILSDCQPHHIIPHGLRHTFVSDLLNQGVDGLIITSLVGHAETSNMIRDVYGHTNEQTKIETIKRLEEYRQANQE
ncbi:tyrosine-type recombinase/integrase [Enterococcus ureasiticus]|nr:tyrosine-type recombinase/integrase [Enterococcus sp. DIV0849a]MBO0473927.1 tyrosine-type recombinase/integrase [Enterococcus ureasiticus]